MSKKNRNQSRTRDPTPTQKRTDATSFMCSPSAYAAFITSGYTRLSDCPEVRMCAHIKANLISSMTLHLMQNTSKGDKRVQNELSRKIDIQPNKFMTRKTFMYNIVYTMLLAGEGNQVTYPKYTPEGFIENLVPLKPSGIRFAENAEEGYTIWYGQSTFQPDEVLHFVINPDSEQPWRGTGYRVVLKDIIKGLKQAGATKQALMESPAPSLVIKVDGLTEEFANKEGRAKLLSQYIDSSENGKPWLVPAEAFDVQQVKPLTLNDLAIKSNMELDKRTVAGIFNVPPFMVGAGDYKKEEYNNFITSEIMPFSKTIEQELTRKLLYAPDLYWRFNPRSLFAYDLSEIISAGSEMVDRMSMRRNEWRDWIGMSPDDEMDELLALENYIPANKLGDQNKLNGGDNSNGK